MSGLHTNHGHTLLSYNFSILEVKPVRSQHVCRAQQTLSTMACLAARMGEACMHLLLMQAMLLSQEMPVNPSKP